MLLWLGFAHKQVVISYTPSISAFIPPISLSGFPDVLLDTCFEFPSNSEGISGTGQGPLNMLEWKGNFSWSVEVGEMSVIDFQSLLDLFLSLSSCIIQLFPIPVYSLLFQLCLSETQGLVPSHLFAQVHSTLWRWLHVDMNLCAVDSQLLPFWCCKLNPHRAHVTTSSLLRAAEKIGKVILFFQPVCLLCSSGLRLKGRYKEAHGKWDCLCMRASSPWRIMCSNNTFLVNDHLVELTAFSPPNS